MDAIEELCYEMGVTKMEAMDEYAIFVVINRGATLDLFSVILVHMNDQQ